MFRRRREAQPGPDPHPRDTTGEPLINLALVDAMRGVARHDTAETRALLFQLLLDSTLVVTTPAARAPRSVVTEAGDTIDLVIVHDDDGSVLPVFTSVQSLLAWRPEGGGWSAVPGRAVFQMAATGGTNKVVIDPGSPTNGIITRTELEALAHGRLPIGDIQFAPGGTVQRFGMPATPPPAETLAAVTEALAAEPRVDRAWLTLMQFGTAEPELTIAVRFGPNLGADAEQEATRSMIDDAVGRCDPVRALVFMRVDDDLEASLAAGSGQEIFRR